MKRTIILALFLSVLVFLVGCSESEKKLSGTHSTGDLNSGTISEQSKLSDKNDTILRIYSIDEKENSLKISNELSVNSEISLVDKLNVIANEISQRYFEGLEIKVVKIEDSVAYVNLIDGKTLGDNEEIKSWMSYLNNDQHVAGVTYEVLTENFFQREISTDWINGIQLLHNGKVMEQLQFFPAVANILK